jgi:hypothetical protein
MNNTPLHDKTSYFTTKEAKRGNKNIVKVINYVKSHTPHLIPTIKRDLTY